MSNKPRCEWLRQVQNGNHVDFQIQSPPNTGCVSPEKEGRWKFIKFLPQSYLMFLLIFSVSLTFPLPFVDLQHTREHFLLGPTLSQWKCLRRYCLWSISWWSWNHSSLSTWVTFWGIQIQESVGSLDYSLSGVSVWVLLFDLFQERHHAHPYFFFFLPSSN